MGRRHSIDGRFQAAGTPTYLATPEEGVRLVKAFLRITSLERRKAVLRYVEDIARIDEAERAR
jgi:hypothetical protein